MLGKSELQLSLENDPATVSRYTCYHCRQRIGSAEYVVSFEGCARHRDCFDAALGLIKRHIEPNEVGADLHAAVQILVTIRERKLLW